MQIKKFEAPTMQEALDAIKRELGPEAIILQTKRNKKGFGLVGGASIEVTAAISDRSQQKKTFAERKLPAEHRDTLHKMSASKQADILDRTLDREMDRRQALSRAVQTVSSSPAPRAGTERRYAEIDSHEVPEPAPSRVPAAAPVGAKTRMQGVSTLEDEVQYLKRMIEELKVAQEERGPGASVAFSTQISSSPALMDAFEHLLMNGVDKRFALGLVKKAAFELGPDDSLNPDAVMDQVTYELLQATETVSPFANLVSGRGQQPVSEGQPPVGPSIIALVGPTGVGKTTTIAKIASQALLQKSLRVGVINLDTYKIAASDQLATYARILNIPFRSAGNAEELAAALGDFQSLDLVLIDTTGRSQRDPASLNEMNELLRSAGKAMQTHLVISATTRDVEAYDTATRFGVFKPCALILSKLDESTLYGAVHNVSQKAKLPLSWFTVGQRVPEDIEEASKERVAALIMDL